MSSPRFILAYSSITISSTIFGMLTFQMLEISDFLQSIRHPLSNASLTNSLAFFTNSIGSILVIDGFPPAAMALISYSKIWSLICDCSFRFLWTFYLAYLCHHTVDIGWYVESHGTVACRNHSSYCQAGYPQLLVNQKFIRVSFRHKLLVSFTESPL